MALTPDAMSGQALGLHSSGMLTMQGVAAALAGTLAQHTSPGAAIALMAAASVTVTLALARGLLLRSGLGASPGHPNGQKSNRWFFWKLESAYGTEAAGVLRRRRRRAELHPGGRAGAHQPIRRQRPDPPTGTGTRRRAVRPVGAHRHPHRRGRGRARARPRRARRGRASARRWTR